MNEFTPSDFQHNGTIFVPASLAPTPQFNSTVNWSDRPTDPAAVLGQLSQLVNEYKDLKPIVGIVFKEDIFNQLSVETRDEQSYLSNIPIYSDPTQEEDAAVFEDWEGMLAYRDRINNPEAWVLWKAKQHYGIDDFNPDLSPDLPSQNQGEFPPNLPPL